jgi:hypothetical protein
MAVQRARPDPSRLADGIERGFWIRGKRFARHIQNPVAVSPRIGKRSRLWLNDGSCLRLRPEHPNHVWSYDFVEARTHDGRKVRMLNVIDEFTREGLASGSPASSKERM